MDVGDNHNILKRYSCSSEPGVMQRCTNVMDSADVEVDCSCRVLKSMKNVNMSREFYIKKESHISY